MTGAITRSDEPALSTRAVADASGYSVQQVRVLDGLGVVPPGAPVGAPVAASLDPDVALQRHLDAIARRTLALVAAGADVVWLLTATETHTDRLTGAQRGAQRAAVRHAGQAGASSPATRRAVSTKAGAVTSTPSR